MRAIQGRNSHQPNLALELGNRNFANDLFLTDFGAAKIFAPPAAIASPGPHALIDTVPGDTSTTAVLTVGASPIVSAIDTIADNDFYKIELVAGHEYQIGMFGYTPSGPTDPVGPNGSPLLDSFIELYDSAGNLITSADGGSDTTLNSANSGFDALLTFTATTSGTYYVDARAFDNIPVDGDRGDMVGDYGLFAKDVTDDNSVYTPYYDANSPLYAIDWGTQVDKITHTVRNPDGNEGTRNTGNAQGTPTYNSNIVDIPTLAQQQGVDITGKNVITIYFAKAGDVFVSNDPTNPGLPPATITATGVQDFEHTAVVTALAEFAKVADVVYLEVQDRNQADFIYTSYAGTPGPGVSLLGSMSPPGESDEGLAQFNSADERWNARDLAQGGFSFVTLIHEFGHGHGLAHPHDNGGHSGIMHGVEPEGAGVADYTTGDYDLNQGVFTMMSYEDGWQTSPDNPHNASTTAGYGYLGGLMAFDIAAIQDKYGVNEDYNTGNDVYVMKDVNAAGTFYYSIWDAGGIDEIRYGGARDANIDLRAATLQYEYGGGGWVSYALGIYGGFTIANGVTIENATSGSGTDTLTGNDVANILDGGAGADTLTGGLGNDTYFVDNVGDAVVELAGEGNDIVGARASYTLTAGASVELMTATDVNGTAAINLTGNELANQIWGNAAANVLNGGAGNDALLGFDGNDRLDGSTGADFLLGGKGDDTYFVDNIGDSIAEAAGDGYDVAAANFSFVLQAGSSVELITTGDVNASLAINLTGNELGNEIWGNAAGNVLYGAEGNDSLVGFDGDDTLIGGTGADLLIGGQGNDLYFIDNAADNVAEVAGQGNDIVAATASYALAAGSSVELMTASDVNGSAAIDLTGNELANQLWGNAAGNSLNGGDGNDALLGFDGNDTLIGGIGDDLLIGGNGNDGLTGGAGADVFAFTAALGATNVDTIADFAGGADKIALDDAVFAGLGLGSLAPGAFVSGTAAQDADDRIIYDSATGNLYFDADGNGGGAQVLFATLSNHAAITASDFSVI